MDTNVASFAWGSRRLPVLFGACCSAVGSRVCPVIPVCAGAVCWSAAAAAAAGKQGAQAKSLSTGAHKLLALAGSLKCVLAAGEFFSPPLCLLSLSVQWGGCAPSYMSPLICISG